ncbi:DNA-binding SARP family transcriptional activator [Saccharothrix tamanrassetensis]|uniref:DNA-binding SARP family transcriptional activator n=1 Tax=Saccharothrix tamanrassetensis TaxID=1051531 RepID=A0A841CPG9_9PSEU|nr:BTAD domain-containing putative transcriptional regulator [Saccharothrix tamanrassetensis]MBB5958254.1 DNA-binding SARP family transcriptional activator [Saccharothrix tamanrassetensis]
MTVAGQPLRVALLGPVRAWSGGREVALGSARQRGVFAVLALRPGAVVRRDELIRAVWGDDAPATAEGSVYTYVSVLRKALEPDRPRGTASRLLESVGPGYRLVLDPGASDVAQFEALRQRARRQLDDGAPEDALRSVDEALALWHGTPMTGLEGPFARAQRLRLGEARTAARELRAEAALAAGAHLDVIAELGALVTEEPLRERARELLMSALHQAGRSAEALEVFREARQVLRDELGVEPGPGLRAAHERVLGTGPELPVPRREAVRAPARPVSGPAEPVLLGREHEVAAVRELVGDLAAGRGRMLWVEGEMGIGKSTLLGVARARAGAAGYQVAHAVADELGTRFPLRLAVDCLGVDVLSPDPRRAEAARALRDRRAVSGSVFAGGDPTAPAVDRLVALVEQLCADGPLVLALDDLQWADDDSVELWRRLAASTRRLPLLLVGVARPVPRRAGVARLRREAESGGGVVLDLAPLTEVAVAGIVASLVGGEPGPGLRRIATWAGGNPLYAREVADTLVREHAVRFDAGLADVAPDVLDRTPPSLVSAVAHRLDFLSAPTREALRFAALLGGEFAAGDLSVVLARPVPVLLPAFTEAIAGGVLRDAGPRIAFRHPLIRQALYDGTPPAVRTALHQQAAQALAAADAPAEHVAGQLLATSNGIGEWAVPWLVARAPALVHRAPLVAVELLHRCLRSTDPDDDRYPLLTAYLGNALFRLGHDAEAEEQTRRALPRLRDPDRIAEARWTLAYVPFRASRPHAALEALGEALADPVLTDTWRARLLSLLALVQRAGVGELDAAAGSARQAIDAGRRAGDPFSIGQALEVLWQVDAVRRDYVRAVGYLDQALDVVGSEPGLTDLRLVLLDNRVFTLQCLDRLDEATDTLRLAFAAAGQGTPVASLHVGAAVHEFWLGAWDGAVARLDGILADDPELTGFGLREGGPVLLHGVAALIAAHRDDETRLRAHLAAGAELPLVTVAYRENCDFLVAAQATSAARDGDHPKAVELLATMLDDRHAVQTTLRHQWLPELVRLALHCGDRDTARGAVEACEAEAGRETSVARAAAAARRCRCLFDGDPDGLLEVAAHYRSVGRAYELAQTLEDGAVLLDRLGRTSEGADTRQEAVSLYRSLGAAWDVRRITGKPV